MPTSPNPMLDLLSQLSAENPQLQHLIELMRTQQGTTDDGPTREELLQLLRRARKEINRLDATLAALQQDADTLARTTDELAAALGACPHCWGDNPACPTCQGRGKPGAYPPDQALFIQYVLPAVRRRATVATPVAAS